MAEDNGFLMRISTRQWVSQVFNIATYYTSARIKWKAGQTILFLHKTPDGDAVIGYGIVENVFRRDELSEDAKRECEKQGWSRAIELRYVVRFEKPLLIKDTFLKNSKLRGKYFHGLRLNKGQVETMISQAERFQQPLAC